MIQNKALEDKYKKKRSLREEMDLNEKIYQKLEQQAFYSEFPDIPKNTFVQVQSNTDQSTDHYLFIAAQQPLQSHSQVLKLYLIFRLSRPKRPYTISYINSMAEPSAYSEFKKVIETMPFEYFRFLKQLFVLKASFSDRAFNFFSFGTIATFIKNKTVHLDYINDLGKMIGVETKKLVELLPQKLLSNIESSEKPKPKERQAKPKVLQLNYHIEPSDLPFRSVRSAGREQLSQSKPKEQQKEFTDYETGQIGIPLILELLLYYFKEKPAALKEEGLFRKSSAVEVENQLIQNLNSANYNCLRQVQDHHLIATVLKRFLASFRTPVVPYVFYEMLMVQAELPGFTDVVIGAIKGLPPKNFLVMLCLFEFLNNEVLPNVESNKMTISNIAICIGPCIMRAEVSSMRDLADAKKIVAVARLILENFVTIFGNPKQQAQIYRKSHDEKKRSSMKNVPVIESDESDAQEEPELVINLQTPSFNTIDEAHDTHFEKIHKIEEADCQDEKAQQTLQRPQTTEPHEKQVPPQSEQNQETTDEHAKSEAKDSDTQVQASE